jgi:hypothetical protein
MSRPETRVAPPTVPHVTPVQALMPVTQGSYGAEPGHQLISTDLLAEVRALNKSHRAWPSTAMGMMHDFTFMYCVFPMP